MDSGSEALYGHRVEFDSSCFFSGNRDEFNSLSASCGVKGRLSAAVDFWKSTLKAPDFVVSIITRGYRLPFARYPPPCFLANNRLAFQHPEFVSQAMCKLLENDCIIEHSTPPFCANPFSVAEGKKLGLVIDLRHVNNFLVRFQFSLSMRTFAHYLIVLEEWHWFFTWDLRLGYHQTYLCFSWRHVLVS